MSVRPASLRPATRLDPMNPAPPVTSNIAAAPPCPPLCPTVVNLLRQRFPSRPIDMLTTTMVAPLIDYMPGVRKGVVVDLPRKRIAFAAHRALARRLQAEGYGQALVMPRTWKSALAPYLAGIPERTGFV